MSKLDLNSHKHEDNTDITTATSRLRHEAQQATSFGQRGVRDVTQMFTEAANQLVPGQLVKDEFFTLFEAVGALEVSCDLIDVHAR